MWYVKYSEHIITSVVATFEAFGVNIKTHPWHVSRTCKSFYFPANFSISLSTWSRFKGFRYLSEGSFWSRVDTEERAFGRNNIAVHVVWPPSPTSSSISSVLWGLSLRRSLPDMLDVHCGCENLLTPGCGSHRFQGRQPRLIRCSLVRACSWV